MSETKWTKCERPECGYEAKPGDLLTTMGCCDLCGMIMPADDDEAELDLDAVLGAFGRARCPACGVQVVVAKRVHSDVDDHPAAALKPGVFYEEVLLEDDDRIDFAEVRFLDDHTAIAQTFDSEETYRVHHCDTPPRVVTGIIIPTLEALERLKASCDQEHFWRFRLCSIHLEAIRRMDAGYRYGGCPYQAPDEWWDDGCVAHTILSVGYVIDERATEVTIEQVEP